MVIGGVVILLLIYFLFPRSRPKERVLNFSKERAKSAAAHTAHQTGSLNVFFNFNGHSFDAYEALGVPAGSTLEEIQRAFQRSIQGTDPASQEFFNAAFQAIQQVERHR